MKLFRRKVHPLLAPPEPSESVVDRSALLPYTWEEKPWNIEDEAEEEHKLGVWFDDDFAHDQEDYVAALAVWLDEQPAVLSAFHSDREYIVVEKGDLTKKVLDRMVAAFLANPADPKPPALRAEVVVPHDGVIGLELIEGSSAKFWKGWVQDDDLVVHFGRIGTAGQQRRTPCGSPEAAQTRLQKTAGEKLAKGYSRGSTG